MNKQRFVSFGTIGRLKYIGRYKTKLKDVAGEFLKTMVDITRGVQESLLGRPDTVGLGNGILDF